MSALQIPNVNPRHAPLPFTLQPIVATGTDEVFAYELLYRGQHPDDWTSVDHAVLRHLPQLGKLPHQCFINLSNPTILQECISSYVPDSLRSRFVFELSETPIDNAPMMDIARRINQMTSEGIRFALDDFGSGLDGMLRLSVLESVAFIKLDRIFLKHVSSNCHTQQNLAMLIQHWRTRDIKIVAEGVETSLELDFANAIGANFVQGFFVDANIAALHQRAAFG